VSTQTANDLRAARKLIEKPSAWCKRRSIIDINGFLLSPDEAKRAVKFCALGATWAIRGIDCDADMALMRAVLQKGFSSIGHFNDHHTTTHADILALFDCAIAAEESAP
jgi:hypothetical protein